MSVSYEIARMRVEVLRHAVASFGASGALEHQIKTRYELCCELVGLHDVEAPATRIAGNPEGSAARR